ncbi:hypothetical protein [Methylobacterium sp. R2-1]|nr:hypothetical protein [Methylobacterium sp. R2-1]MBB2962167.1 hypothetical protein [Methylobacterium sp. R2-1]
MSVTRQTTGGALARGRNVAGAIESREAGAVKELFTKTSPLHAEGFPER